MASPASSSMHGVAAPEPCVIVIFGASGDLTHRKLIPSLYDLFRQGALPEKTKIMGVSRTPMSDDEFRDGLRPSVEKFAAKYEAPVWARFSKFVHYQPGDAAQMAAGDPITSRITALGKEAGILKPSGPP